jgi:uncharacterized lipoprotein YmbA
VGTTAGEQLADSGIALGNIRVADYIDQPGLVLASGDGKIHAARSYVWAEPLQVSLRRYLAIQISSGIGREVVPSANAASKIVVDVSIDELHGNGRGAAVLVAYWELVGGGATTSYRFSEQENLAGDGYDALVQAEQALLKRLAGAIAGSLPPA